MESNGTTNENTNRIQIATEVFAEAMASATTTQVVEELRQEMLKRFSTEDETAKALTAIRLDIQGLIETDDLLEEKIGSGPDEDALNAAIGEAVQERIEEVVEEHVQMAVESATEDLEIPDAHLWTLAI